MPGLPFFSIFGCFSSLFVVPCLPPCFVCLFGQSLRLSLVCLVSLSAMLAETNKLFQLSFKYFNIFHYNILYFQYYHLLILPPYTFPPSITFFYIPLFHFISTIHSIIFSFILSVHFCTVSCFYICAIGTIMQGYYYLSDIIVYDVSRRLSLSFLQASYFSSLFVYLYSHTLLFVCFILYWCNTSYLL